MGKNMDLKLEELRLERNELDARIKLLSQKQRSIESMLTDLTRSIKQMEFDIDLMQRAPEAAPQREEQSVEPPQPQKTQQKI